MRYTVPKSNATILIGHKVKNVAGEWYIKGGTCCCRCCIAYSFDESHKIYLRDKELNRQHGIPRCPNCGQSLRCRSKPNSYSGFWKKMEKINDEK